MSASALITATPGASAHLVVQIQRVGNDGRITAVLLEKHGRDYRRTSASVVAQLTGESAVVMGAASDLKPDAVVELSGRFDARLHLRVARVVVLTPYVTVVR